MKTPSAMLLTFVFLTACGDTPVSPKSQTPDTSATTPVTDLVLIPAGQFVMGDHQGLGGLEHGNDEVPLHSVQIDSFRMAATEVTTKDYVAFLNAALADGAVDVVNGVVVRKGSSDVYCDTRQAVAYSRVGWNGTTFSVLDARETHPIVGVRWLGAAAYTNWLSRKAGMQPCYDLSTGACNLTQRAYRLPTEAEWEYAARGGQLSPYRLFPWGDDTTARRANWPESGHPYQAGSYPWTTPVGFFNGELRRKSDYGWPSSAESYQTLNGANAYGLYDMSGNAWEWVNDWYATNYYAVSPSSNPPGPATGTPMPDGKSYRTLRGGSWYNGQWGHGRVSNRNPSYYRGPDDPNHAWYHVGFRVALKGAP